MSEIVFPNEVIPEIDTTNHDTIGLITCQLDNGTTVTNCLTGAVGESFDVANQLGNDVAADAIRISATWSTGKPTGIDDNPFSLLKIDEDEQKKYGLKFSGTQDVTFDKPAINGGDFVFEIDLEITTDRETSYYYSENDGAGLNLYNGNSNFGSNAGQIIIWGSDRQLDVTGLSLGAYKLRYERVGITSTVYVNDVLHVTADNVVYPSQFETATSAMLGAQSTGVNNASFMVTRYFFSCSAGSRLWSFNKTQGDTVTDLISGAIATLNGFSADGGYVRDNFGDLSHYLFGGGNYLQSKDGRALANTANWYVELEFRFTEPKSTTYLFNNAYQNGNGLGLYVRNTAGALTVITPTGSLHGFTTIDMSVFNTVKIGSEGGVIKIWLNGEEYLVTSYSSSLGDSGSITFWRVCNFNHITSGTKDGLEVRSLRIVDLDNSRDHQYDFTTGSSSYIPDTNQSDSVDIIDGSISKWQPVVPIDVTTIGPDGWQDYAKIYDWQIARKGSAGSLAKQIGIIYGTPLDTAKTYTYANQFELSAELRAAPGHEYNPKSPNSPCANIPVDIWFYNTFITFRNIKTEQVTAGNGSYYSCFIKKYVAPLNDNRVRNTIKDSYVGSIYGIGADTLFLNSIVNDRLNFNTSNDTITVNFEDCLLPYGSNNHILNTPTVHFNNCKVANNQDLSVNGSFTNGEQGVDMSTWFSDKDNGDWSITEDGKAALQGQGFNGGDIASWAYLAVSGAHAIYADLDIRNQVLGSVFSELDIRNKVISALSSIISDLDLRNQILASVYSDIELVNQIRGISVSDLELQTSILSFVSSDVDIRNSIAESLGTVVSDLELRTSVHNAVHSTLEIQNNILQIVLSDTDIRNQILASTSKDVDLRAAIRNSTQADLDIRTAVFSFVASDLEITSQVFGGVQRDLEIQVFLDGELLDIVDVDGLTFTYNREELSYTLLNEQLYFVTQSQKLNI